MYTGLLSNYEALYAHLQIFLLEQLAAEMEYERIAAQRKLDEEIFAEICEGLQERANKQAR